MIKLTIKHIEKLGMVRITCPEFGRSKGIHCGSAVETALQWLRQNGIEYLWYDDESIVLDRQQYGALHMAFYPERYEDLI